MPKDSHNKKSANALHTGGVPSPIAEIGLDKEWKKEIIRIAKAAAAAATATVAAAVAAVVDVAATVAVACGGGSVDVAMDVAAGKAAAVAAAVAADRALACGTMHGWAVSGGDRRKEVFDIREVLMMGRCVSSSLPCWASLAIDHIMEAAKELNICLATTGIVVDASNQMAMTQSLMKMPQFRSMFGQTVVVAAETTYVNGLGAAFNDFMHIVPDGRADLGEKRGKNEDAAVAMFIDELTRLGKSALVLSGDGKVVEDDDKIIRAVEAHLQAGLPLIILAKDGTCSGNYDALQEMYPDLLQVIRCFIPE